jgi:hypothetical protein
MLPVVRDDNCDEIYFLLVTFYEPSMISKGCNILPAVESRSVNQQSDFPVSTDDRIDLRRNLAEVVSLQFLRCRDPQYVVRNNFRLNHVKSPQTKETPSACSSIIQGGGKRRATQGAVLGCSLRAVGEGRTLITTGDKTKLQ